MEGFNIIYFNYEFQFLTVIGITSLEINIIGIIQKNKTPVWPCVRLAYTMKRGWMNGWIKSCVLIIVWKLLYMCWFKFSNSPYLIYTTSIWIQFFNKGTSPFPTFCRKTKQYHKRTFIHRSKRKISLRC